MVASTYFMFTANEPFSLIASAFITLGIVLLFLPPPWSSKAWQNIVAALGLLASCFLPWSIYKDAELSQYCLGSEQDRAIALQEVKIAPSWTDDLASSTLSGGIHHASASPEAYKWSGYLSKVPACDHTLELDARLLFPDQTSDGQGWGHGVGLCSDLNGREPQGLSWQYGAFQAEGSVGGALYPRVLPQADTYHPSEERVAQVTRTDKEWHHWTLTVRDGAITGIL